MEQTTIPRLASSVTERATVRFGDNEVKGAAIIQALSRPWRAAPCHPAVQLAPLGVAVDRAEYRVSSVATPRGRRHGGRTSNQQMGDLLPQPDGPAAHLDGAVRMPLATAERHVGSPSRIGSP